MYFMGPDEVAQRGVGDVVEPKRFVATYQGEVAAATLAGDLVDGIHQGIVSKHLTQDHREAIGNPPSFRAEAENDNPVGSEQAARFFQALSRVHVVVETQVVVRG